MDTPQLWPTYAHETELMESGSYSCIVGIDEAGRGPGAGPVVACAIHIPADDAKRLSGRVQDSKKLSRKERQTLFRVLATGFPHGIGIVDNRMIDQINILEATKLAIRQAAGQIKAADYALIDGNMKLEDFHIPYQSIVKGDGLILSIAAASIVAKETIDRIMETCHEEYPMYGWDRNKGYLSQKHMEAIQKYGPTPYHRLSFRKVGR